MTDTEQTIEEQEHEQAAAPGASEGMGPHPPDSAAHSDEAELEVDQESDEQALQGDVDDAPGDHPADGDATEIEGDLDELVETAAQRDEYLALAQRTQADFENYRKRVARESAAAQERGVAKLCKELLPALDNLDRAIGDFGTAADPAVQAVCPGGRDDPLLDGVRLVRAELSAGLTRVGIESFGAVGDTFDPVEHEAMAQQPVEGAQSGTVVEVYQPGYRLGANVIRPARVLVAA